MSAEVSAAVIPPWKQAIIERRKRQELQEDGDFRRLSSQHATSHVSPNSYLKDYHTDYTVDSQSWRSVNEVEKSSKPANTYIFLSSDIGMRHGDAPKSKHELEETHFSDHANISLKGVSVDSNHVQNDVSDKFSLDNRFNQLNDLDAKLSHPLSITDPTDQDVEFSGVEVNKPRVNFRYASSSYSKIYADSPPASTVKFKNTSGLKKTNDKGDMLIQNSNSECDFDADTSCANGYNGEVDAENSLRNVPGGEGEFQYGRGFVNKLLEKFKHLSSREDQTPSLCPKRSSSSENILETSWGSSSHGGGSITQRMPNSPIKSHSMENISPRINGNYMYGASESQQSLNNSFTKEDAQVAQSDSLLVEELPLPNTVSKTRSLFEKAVQNGTVTPVYSEYTSGSLRRGDSKLKNAINEKNSSSTLLNILPECTETAKQSDLQNDEHSMVPPEHNLLAMTRYFPASKSVQDKERIEAIVLASHSQCIADMADMAEKEAPNQSKSCNQPAGMYQIRSYESAYSGKQKPFADVKPSENATPHKNDNEISANKNVNERKKDDRKMKDGSRFINSNSQQYVTIEQSGNENSTERVNKRALKPDHHLPKPSPVSVNSNNLMPKNVLDSSKHNRPSVTLSNITTTHVYIQPTDTSSTSIDQLVNESKPPIPVAPKRSQKKSQHSIPPLDLEKMSDKPFSAKANKPKPPCNSRGSLLIRTASNLTTPGSSYVNLTHYDDVTEGTFEPSTNISDIPFTSIDSVIDEPDLTEAEPDDVANPLPTRYEFTGAGVKLSKNLLAKTKQEKFKLSFNDSLASTYEYPSEQSLLEELGLPPDYSEGRTAEGASDSDGDEPRDSVMTSSPSSLRSNSAITNAGLSNYKAKYQVDYKFGQENPASSALKQSPARDEPAMAEGPEKPGSSSWSENNSSDLLF